MAVNEGHFPEKEKDLINSKNRNDKNKATLLHKKQEQKSNSRRVQKELQSLQETLKILPQGVC